MEIALYIIIGVVLGAVAVGFFLNRQLSALRLTDADKSATLKLKTEELTAKTAKLEQLQKELKLRNGFKKEESISAKDMIAKDISDALDGQTTMFGYKKNNNG